MPIPHSLLELLTDGPASASDLRRRFQELTHQQWPLNKGQVSQTLGRLNRDGLIRSMGSEYGPSGHATELFAITETGNEELLRWWRSPVVHSENQRDELVIKISLAAATKSQQLPDLIQRQREAVMSELRSTTMQLRELPKIRSADRLLLERRIFNLEAENRWLDRIDTLKDA
ncbi:helix-turn-helix transcriptional regulator [Corynebacterium hindlerae]|uniref:Helix-turn-helix transcriptional regulator n=1 Tax=Corynebacterium hindlerae TaxID=699041 RepID=A0A7G5FE42_9CORY|nr:helix-turn-helix transcriptional regulator [Corynebacterium hindlerae]QMV84883.1 helix-turn-helix transcriptional regulator [Corynebacterium hindlerae]QTH59220.1 helix-turn-helix transcriptional regulator [Corynebacterium hindlerae]